MVVESFYKREFSRREDEIITAFVCMIRCWWLRQRVLCCRNVAGLQIAWLKEAPKERVLHHQQKEQIEEYPNRVSVQREGAGCCCCSDREPFVVRWVVSAAIPSVDRVVVYEDNRRYQPSLPMTSNYQWPDNPSRSLLESWGRRPVCTTILDWGLNLPSAPPSGTDLQYINIKAHAG